MEPATRRIVWFAVTDHPDRDWVSQQARSLVWELEGAGKRILIHDHDAKFAGSVDRIVEAAGVRVIGTPIAAPEANAQDLTEAWICGRRASSDPIEATAAVRCRTRLGGLLRSIHVSCAGSSIIRIAGFHPIANVSWVRALILYAILEIVYQISNQVTIARFDVVAVLIALIVAVLLIVLYPSRGVIWFAGVNTKGA